MVDSDSGGYDFEKERSIEECKSLKAFMGARVQRLVLLVIPDDDCGEYNEAVDPLDGRGDFFDANIYCEVEDEEGVVRRFMCSVDVSTELPRVEVGFDLSVDVLPYSMFEKRKAVWKTAKFWEQMEAYHWEAFDITDYPAFGINKGSVIDNIFVIHFVGDNEELPYPRGLSLEFSGERMPVEGAHLTMAVSWGEGKRTRFGSGRLVPQGNFFTISVV